MGAGAVTIEVVNEGDVPIGLTSHFHVFEANGALRFDRASAWGMRLDVPAGVKVFFEPGVPLTVHLRPFGGARVIRGHGGLVDGPLDTPGARRGAAAGPRAGFRGA